MSKTEIFINKSIAKFGQYLDYSLTDFISTTKLIKLICPTHGLFEITPKAHLNNKWACAKCYYDFNNQLSIEQFISKSKEKFLNKFDYSKCNYINYDTKFILICNEHGEFTTTYSLHMKTKTGGCPNCNPYKKLTIKKFIEKANKIHNNFYDYSLSIYIDYFKKIKIICPIHGIFEQTPSNHLQYGCIICSGKYLKTTDWFINEAVIIHENKYDYSQSIYTGMFKKLKIICKEHGEFWQIPTNHIHNKRGCPKCSKRISKNEILWLNSLNIPNDKKHRNVYLKINNKRYYVDGFNPETNTVYEFDGDYWHGNPNIYDQNKIHPEANKTFGELYKRTLNRKQNLENAGYKVISIWETEFLSQNKESNNE